MLHITTSNGLDRFLFAVRQRLLRSPFRFSRPFSFARDYFSKSYHEEILDVAMQFATMCGIEGDYLEFGVFEGDSFVAAFHLARKYQLPNMRFYAFDSFEGLPQSTGIDATDQPGLAKGALSSGGVERFRSIISRRGVDLRKVDLIPGFYQDSLKRKLPIKSAAIVYIDCDLYASTKPVLEFIGDYLQDGTILIFDDWFLFKGRPDRGEQRAFREWLAASGRFRASEFRKFGWHGNSFIVHLD